MKKLLLLTYQLIILSVYQLHAQNVGIGTETPNASALLHVELGTSTKGFLVTGTASTSSIPSLGSGSRLMFYPGISAFRAGFVSGAEWDDVNVGRYSVAMGYSTIASGFSSIAIGRETNAGGDYSVAMGYKVNTAFRNGAFFFGDSDPYNKGVRLNTADDQFAARFNGGYYFISSNSGSDIGVRVLSGQNSWSVISDVNRKENFLPVDGESFLDKISKLNLTTWNYKGQDKENFRHYGPMAQDFNAAFGKDDLGNIGCDTLINQQDFLGVNLIAIQALEKRTEKLTEENNDLREENKTLKNSMDKLNERLEKLEKMINK